MQLPLRSCPNSPTYSECSELTPTSTTENVFSQITVNKSLTPMSSDLEPGVYVLRNLRSNSVIDLSGGDGKSIIGFPRHGLENQQVSKINLKKHFLGPKSVDKMSYIPLIFSCFGI